VLEYENPYKCCIILWLLKIFSNVFTVSYISVYYFSKYFK